MRINLVIADTDDGSFETWRRHPNLDGVNARAPSAAIFCASQPAGKQLNKGTLHLPARAEDYPDRDSLALRFERFRAAA